jgi:cephalosporin hydroxylase
MRRTLWGLVIKAAYERVVYSRKQKRDIVSGFHRLYYDSRFIGGTWRNTHWLGVPTQKCPLDLWIYQEIVHELRPDLIIETGTADGGSALFFASICDHLNHGRIVTVDLLSLPRPEHDRVTYIQGSSVAPEVAEKTTVAAKDARKVLVILDSNHEKGHVLAEMRLYADLVTRGSYMVVEDTNLNGHPVDPGFGPGPFEAVTEFLNERDDFVVDESREKFYLTFNPRGYLRRR